MDPNNPTPKPTPMEALLQRIAFHQREASDAEAALRQMLNNQMAEAVSYTHLTLPTNREV